MHTADIMAGRNPDSPRPIIQLAIDVVDRDQAISVGEMGLRAGVDWLELGTPLVAFEGVNNLEEFSQRFHHVVTFLDGKVMDAPGRYVSEAARMGINIVCLCAAATDASFRAALAAAQGTDVKIVGDLYGIADPLERARELAALGVDLIYLHYGFDQCNEDIDANPTVEQIGLLKSAVDTPIGVVTFSEENGVAAAQAGADIVLVTHPFLVGEGAEERLTSYVRAVKAAGSAARQPAS